MRSHDRRSGLSVAGIGPAPLRGLLVVLVLAGCGARAGVEVTERRPLGDEGAGGASGTGTAGAGAAPGGTLSGLLDLDVGNAFGCALRNDGTLRCWGENEAGQLGTGSLDDAKAPTLTEVQGASMVSLGAIHGCAIVGPGMACWGKNDFGQLGRGTVTPFEASPAPVVGAKPAQISAGGQHTCFVDSSGLVRCFGWNLHGQLGDGTHDDASVPVLVKGLGGAAKKVSVGFVHSCALRTDGFVVCWGLGSEGQLGNGTTQSSPVPVLVAGLAGGVVDVVVGGWHTCARKGDGSLWCWGHNTNGGLGDGTTVHRTSPVKVPLDGVSQVDVDAGHTCARTVGDALWCWGWNVKGQVGDGSTTDRLSPVAVPAPQGFVDVALGYWHTCARTQLGAVSCWGHGADGQLGNGGLDDAATPTPVTWP